MIAADVQGGCAIHNPSVSCLPGKSARQSKDPDILADVYRPDTTMAIWHRQLPRSLEHAAADLLAIPYALALSMVVSPDRARDAIGQALPSTTDAVLYDDMAYLVEMYCCLMGVSDVGLRLTKLDEAMCPKFHVDTVPCRLITTYAGTATQWLAHNAVDRSKLGRGSGGLPDSESGLYSSDADIQQLASGDVALLKGELWEGNENAGVVHRSPVVAAGESRLLMTLDMVTR